MTATALESSLLTARYGREQALEDPTNPVLQALLAHRSIRRYRPDPLPVGTLELLIAAAQSASTSSNLQTWSVVAVEDPARKARLAVLAGNQAQIEQAPLMLVWLADLARLGRAAESRGIAPQALDSLEMFTVAAIDAALAAQNAAVAAEALGLGIVYIGAMRNQPEAVSAELNLPPRSFALFGMCVGYPDQSRPHAVRPRLPQAAVLQREQYDLAAQDAAVAEYAATMDRFYAEQQMRVQGDWIEHSARRVTGPESLSGRDRLRAALAALGFPLE